MPHRVENLHLVLPSTVNDGDPEPAQVCGAEAGDPRAEGVSAGLEPAVPAAARLALAVRGRDVAQAAEQIAQEVRLSLSHQVRKRSDHAEVLKLEVKLIIIV